MAALELQTYVDCRRLTSANVALWGQLTLSFFPGPASRSGMLRCAVEQLSRKPDGKHCRCNGDWCCSICARFGRMYVPR